MQKTISGMIVKNGQETKISIPAILLCMDALSLTAEIRDRAIADMDEEMDQEDLEDIDVAWLRSKKVLIDDLDAWIKDPVGFVPTMTDLPQRQLTFPLQINSQEDLQAYAARLVERSVQAETDETLRFRLDVDRGVLWVDTSCQPLRRVPKHVGLFVTITSV